MGGRRDPDATLLAEAILWPVRDFYRALDDALPAEIAVPLAVAFGRRLLAVMLDEALGPPPTPAPPARRSGHGEQERAGGGPPECGG